MRTVCMNVVFSQFIKPIMRLLLLQVYAVMSCMPLCKIGSWSLDPLSHSRLYFLPPIIQQWYIIISYHFNARHGYILGEIALETDILLVRLPLRHEREHIECVYWWVIGKVWIGMLFVFCSHLIQQSEQFSDAKYLRMTREQQQQASSVTGVKEFRKWRRVHGLQLPLHPQQVLSWVFLVSFTLYIFLTLIPAIHSRWDLMIPLSNKLMARCFSAQLPLLVVNVLIFLTHYITHLVSLLIDPSDPALLAQMSRRAVPEFDKSKFNHVIENGRCHLCNINISSSRTKHCSVCNKCVHVFDHHCKWLNQCIGRRNYVPFFICVLSAIMMCLSFVSLAVTEMTLYFANPSLLSPWQHSSLMVSNSSTMETTITTAIPDFDSLTATTSSLEPSRNSTGRSLFINQPDTALSDNIYQESGR